MGRQSPARAAAHPKGAQRVPQAVVVLGASSGIGRATALRYARDGAHLTLVARGRESLQAAAEACVEAGAGSAIASPADVTDADALEHVVREAVLRHGGIDVVVHSAAVMAYGSVEQLPPPVFQQVVDTTVQGTANVARAVLPQFRRQREGTLVVVNSLLGSIAAPLMGAYVTAKWAQLGLLRTLQLETRDVPGIRVKVVSPGGVATPIYYHAANVIGREGRPPQPVYSPERVARAITATVRGPRRVVQSGVLNPLIIAGFRLMPAVYDRLVGPLLSAFALSRNAISPTDGNVFRPITEPEAADDASVTDDRMPEGTREVTQRGDAAHARWRAL